MPQIIVNAFVTLDGVMQAPGGPEEDPEAGFVHGGWMAPFDDEVVGQHITAGFADADAFLLGRKTYDIFASYWPKITDPAHAIATALNTRPKYVVSRHLERLDWHNARLLPGDLLSELRQLRAQPGQSVQTWGSTELLQTLRANDLVDEYRLFIFPLVLGTGKRLFGSGTRPAAFKRLASATGDQGATYLRLARDGLPRYGQMGDQDARTGGAAS